MSRIHYVDTIKALLIILVIVGHCHSVSDIPFLSNAIYSFHMPLFFIISGFFFKPLSVNDGLKKYSKAYLVPYFVTVVIALCLVSLISLFITPSPEKQLINGSLLTEWFVRAGFASGWGWSKFLGEVPIIGPVWFLWGLFFSKLLYTYISSRWIGIEKWIITLLVFSFSIWSIKLIQLPFSFQGGCFGMVYIMFGYYIRKFDLIQRFSLVSPIYILILCGLWGLAVYEGGYNLGCCLIGGFLPFVMSFILPLMVLSYFLKHPNFFRKFGVAIGNHTLSILCAHSIFHYISYMYGEYWTFLNFNPIVNLIIEALLETSIAIAGSYLLQYLPLTRKVFINK